MQKLIPPVLRELYSYDPETGQITRKVRTGNYQAGTVCSALSTNGRYLKVGYLGVDYLLHRVAWFLHYNEQPPEVLDHVDGDGMNNAINNLRAATTSTNGMNIKVTSKSTSGIKGIFPVRGGKLWRAEVCVEGKRYQKHSAKPERLVAWVESMREQLHGEFCHH